MLIFEASCIVHRQRSDNSIEFIKQINKELSHQGLARAVNNYPNKFSGYPYDSNQKIFERQFRRNPKYEQENSVFNLFNTNPFLSKLEYLSRKFFGSDLIVGLNDYRRPNHQKYVYDVPEIGEVTEIDQEITGILEVGSAGSGAAALRKNFEEDSFVKTNDDAVISNPDFGKEDGLLELSEDLDEIFRKPVEMEIERLIEIEIEAGKILN